MIAVGVRMTYTHVHSHTHSHTPPVRDTASKAFLEAHPELERASNEMVLSYVCNTMDPDALFQPGLRWADGYIPRFVRVLFDRTGKLQGARPAKL